MDVNSAINDVANIIALSAGIPVFLFTLVYGLGSPWFKSWLGVTLFGLMFSLSILFVVILLRRFLGEYPGYPIVSIIAYSLLTVMFWSFFAILLVERRREHPLHVVLRAELDTDTIKLLERNTDMRKFADWFTGERRQKIQAFVVTLVPIAIFLGYGTEGSWEQWLIILGSTLAAVGSLLSLVNVRIQDWSTQGWAIVRGAVYTLGTTVSPAFMLLGFYNEQVNTQVVTGISLAITALSSAISIFANGQQQKAEIVQELRVAEAQLHVSGK